MKTALVHSRFLLSVESTESLDEENLSFLMEDWTRVDKPEKGIGDKLALARDMNMKPISRMLSGDDRR